LPGVGNSLEALTGDREGRHAIRVNLQMQIVLRMVGQKQPARRN
jgi:plasmid maintenance system killer protein